VGSPAASPSSAAFLEALGPRGLESSARPPAVAEPLMPRRSATNMGYTCVLCQDIFCPPASLPCGHTFCQDCLVMYFENTLLRSAGDVRTTICPAGARCQVPIHVPEVNYTLKQRMEEDVGPRYLDRLRQRTCEDQNSMRQRIDAIHAKVRDPPPPQPTTTIEIDERTVQEFARMLLDVQQTARSTAAIVSGVCTILGFAFLLRIMAALAVPVPDGEEARKLHWWLVGILHDCPRHTSLLVRYGLFPFDADGALSKDTFNWTMFTSCMRDKDEWAFWGSIATAPYACHISATSDSHHGSLWFRSLNAVECLVLCRDIFAGLLWITRGDSTRRLRFPRRAAVELKGFLCHSLIFLAYPFFMRIVVPPKYLFILISNLLRDGYSLPLCPRRFLKEMKLPLWFASVQAALVLAAAAVSYTPPETAFRSMREHFFFCDITRLVTPVLSFSFMVHAVVRRLWSAEEPLRHHSTLSACLYFIAEVFFFSLAVDSARGLTAHWPWYLQPDAHQGFEYADLDGFLLLPDKGAMFVMAMPILQSAISCAATWVSSKMRM